VNDQVWLESKNLKIPYQSRKLAPKREGPFKIKEVLGPVTYQLTLLKQWKIHDVFHACLLMPCKETELHGPNETRPPPNLVQGNEEYEIETIVLHRCHKNHETTYLIKWKGYLSSENSWITESDLDFKPKKGKIYPLNPLQQNTLDEWIKEQLAKGYIRQSKSPQASPFFFVEKKDAKKLRPCQDYRYLNEFTKPNAYPLLLISVSKLYYE
jgi:hypothetical protein